MVLMFTGGPDGAAAAVQSWRVGASMDAGSWIRQKFGLPPQTKMIDRHSDHLRFHERKQRTLVERARSDFRRGSGSLTLRLESIVCPRCMTQHSLCVSLFVLMTLSIVALLGFRVCWVLSADYGVEEALAFLRVTSTVVGSGLWRERSCSASFRGSYSFVGLCVADTGQ